MLAGLATDIDRKTEGDLRLHMAEDLVLALEEVQQLRADAQELERMILEEQMNRPEELSLI